MPIVLRYGKSLLYEIHSPHLHNVIQLIGCANGASAPIKISHLFNTFDFSHLQLAYTAESGLVGTVQARDAYGSRCTRTNPNVKRIHAYRFVKVSRDGWDIAVVPSPQLFIANYPSCSYRNGRNKPHYVPGHVWTRDTLDIKAMAEDPIILGNLLRKCWTPDFSQPENILRETLATHKFDDLHLFHINDPALIVFHGLHSFFQFPCTGSNIAI